MALTGTWHGTYAYDSPLMPEQVGFSIEIEELESGRFQGQVQDGEGGHPMAGRIEGKSQGSNIEFVKTMPATLFRLPGGSFATQPGKAQMIHYRGLSEEPNTFKGTWTLRGRFVFFRCIPTIAWTSHGTWRMWRVS